MTILIITHSHDNECIPKVMQAIDEQGGTAFRFNTDEFPTEGQLDLACSRHVEAGLLTSEQGSLALGMEHLSLNYGAIDMILTSDNRHVFLEVNPCGEFFWLDLLPGLAISQTIAKHLLNPLKG